MKIPRWLQEKLNSVARKNIFFREPDFIIGGKDNPYLLRWWIIPRNPFFNIYLHVFCRSDDDRALHDHPWINMSILLNGNYIEHTPLGKFERREGFAYMRRAQALHRVELYEERGKEKRCMTLFITGPVIREWGFACPKGWRHWKEFTSPADKGEIGKGCE